MFKRSFLYKSLEKIFRKKNESKIDLQPYGNKNAKLYNFHHWITGFERVKGSQNFSFFHTPLDQDMSTAFSVRKSITCRTY